LNNLAVNNVRSLSGVFSGGANAIRLNASAGVGGVTGIVTDTAHHTLQNIGYYPK